MSFNIIKYIGDSAKRIVTTEDLKNIGATEDDLRSLSGNAVLTFVKNAAHEVETHLAQFIAGHPKLAAEFHLLSDDEAAAESTITNPVSEGSAPGSTDPAGTTPTDAGALPTVIPADPAGNDSPTTSDSTPASSEESSTTGETVAADTAGDSEVAPNAGSAS